MGEGYWARDGGGFRDGAFRGRGVFTSGVSGYLVGKRVEGEGVVY